MRSRQMSAAGAADPGVWLASSPEQEALVCCARASMDANNAERLRELVEQGIDWEYLVWAAHRNRMTPLLYWNLHNTCPESVPIPVMDKLRQNFHVNARHNLRRTRELVKLLGHFKASGVDCMPYKGPLLAFSVYGQLSLRQFKDLDLLIDKQDVETAKELLLSEGYRESYEPKNGEEADIIANPVREFISRDGNIAVDLHWGLERTYLPFPVDLARLRGHMQPVEVAGKTVLGPAPEELVLILCMHGSRHMWNRMKWICDVAELLRTHQGMDWDIVNKLAGNWGCERMLHMGLLLANDLLGAPVPGNLLRKAHADQEVKSLSSQVYERLFVADDTPGGVFGTIVFRTRVRERWRDKMSIILYLAHRALTPSASDLSLIRLPKPLSFLYYLIRPVRLAGIYGVGLFSKTPSAQKPH